MKIILLLSFLIMPISNTSDEVMRWGQIGHRTTGHIATQLLTDSALNEVERVLNGNSLAEVSTWMDEVRSDNNFRFMSPWHYCTIPEGKTYEEAGTPEEGDIIWAIDKMVNELKSRALDAEQEAINLKVLVHLIGDLHQPLHVGNGTDRGGNDVRVQWFGDNSNLHRVWDSEMIDGKQLSFVELADFIDDQLDEETIQEWQSTSVLDWAYESQALLPQVYDYPENGRLSYEYSFLNFDKVELRLLQAGVRLAGLINEIYAD
ncbi:MAG: S1/P1 nuclease [Balneolaceae bacterium]